MAFSNIYQRRRVFVTGHTGFKGAWLALWLKHLGAEVIGYALDAPSEPSAFAACCLGDLITDVRGNICNLDKLQETIQKHQPEVIFHLAAQAIVRTGYADPCGTFATNVLGTANVLEAARRCGCVKAVVAVTSDKVYRNEGWEWGYREIDALGGHDPYSASKAAAEMVIASYQWPHTQNRRDDLAIASARGGNVIGGGDWAADRLVPDTIRAIISQQDITLRYPNATRPWQHVLDCLSGYLHLGERLLTGAKQYRSAWNFGPVDSRATSVETVCRHLLSNWPGTSTRIVIQPGPAGAEMMGLRVDSSKAIHQLAWRPTWNVAQCLDNTLQWYLHFYTHNQSEMTDFSIAQINAYTDDARTAGVDWACPASRSDRQDG